MKNKFHRKAGSLRWGMALIIMILLWTCIVPAALAAPVKVKAISCGINHSLMLLTNGTVVGGGDNSYGQTTIPAGLNDVVAVSADSWFSLALKNDGTVVAWGNNSHGQCNLPASFTDVKAIAAGGPGYFESLALKNDGTVVARVTSAPAGLNGVIAIDAGDYHSLALKSDGTVVAWGNNSYNQLNVPAGLSGVIAIAAGDNHSLALKSDGTVVAWGANDYGQTTLPAGLTDVKAIAAGMDFSMALKNDGSIVIWGLLSAVPAGITDVTAIAAGGNNGLVLKSDGSIVIWGAGVSHQLNMPGSANLSGLAIDIGAPGTLPFAPSVTGYTQYVGGSATSVNITASLATPDYAALYINGQLQTSGAACAVSLTGASTDISVRTEPYILTGKTYTVTVLKDVTPPSVSIGTNGSEAWALSASTTVTASDTESGMDAATLKYAWTTDTAEPTSGWTAFSSGDTITKSGVDGDWYLHIQASDAVGNTANVVSNRFRLDNGGPAVSLASPSGTSVAASTSSIKLDFSETVTGAANKKVTISDGTNTYSYTIGAGDSYISGTGSACTATIPISSFSNGATPLSIGYNTTYTVAVEAGAYIDLSGNGVAAGNIGSFTTLALPTVSAVTPGGTGASLSGNIVITFSATIDTTGTVSLDGGNTSLTGSWSTDKLTYTVPYSGLAYSTQYTATISGFKDTANNMMEADSTHSFTTLADTVKPTVSGVTPTGTGASLSGNMVITFSEAIDTTASGTVSLGGTALTGGTWSTDKLTYTVPYSGLSYSTQYTAAISGFKDTASNVMEADSTHSFTTLVDTVKPTVSGMTPTGTGASLSGNIVITFSEAINTTGTVSLDGTTLTDGTWSADKLTYTIPYPGLAYSTAYTATISGFKDTAGNVMESDSTHSFTTLADTVKPTVASVTPTGTGVSQSGSIVITFSEAIDTTASGTVSFGGTALTGGTWSTDKLTYTVPYSGLSYSTQYTAAISGFADTSGNVMDSDSTHSFTTLADTVKPTVVSVTPTGTGVSQSGSIVITFSEAIDTTASGTVSFGGTALTGGTWSNENKTYTVPYSGLSYSTQYTATISGFKDTASNTIEADSTHSFTTLADTVKPTVASVTPTGTGVSQSGSIVITFSEAIDTTASGTVSLGGTALTGGTWSNENKTYTVPYSGLSYSTQYTAAISGFEDTAGNTMESDSTHSFTTLADTVKPTVASVTPTGTNASLSGNLIITFSESINTTGTVSLDDGSTFLTGGSWSTDKLTYTVPYSGFTYSTLYTAAISGFKDTVSNVMNSDSTHSFTTLADTIKPTVSGMTPTGTGASLSGNMVITFSEAIDTATAGTVSLGGTALTGGTWSTDKLTYTVPYSGLSYSTQYTAAISGFKDTAGNGMDSDSTHSFTTLADTVKPTVSGVTPTGTGAFLSGNLEITFSEAINTTGTVSLGGTALTGGTWSNENKTYTVPYSGLNYSTQYTAAISGFEDTVGNGMDSDSTHSFTTLADTVKPTVSGVTPTGTNASLSGNLIITFSEAIDTTASGTVSLGGTTLTGGTWSNDNKTYTVPYSGLSYSTPYTAAISGFADTASNVMEADSTHSFTTLADTVKPTVSGVTPTGTGAFLSGNLEITFSEAINTTGTVSLGGTALTGGAWSTDKLTYTVPYSGLSYSTQYTAAISGFADTASNVMEADSTHSFTTAAEPYSGGSSGSGSGGSSGGAITVTTNNNWTTATQTFKATIGSNGVAAISVTKDQITDMVKAANEKAQEQDAQTALEIHVDSGSTATSVSVTIPHAAVSSLTDGINALTISSPVVTVTFDEKALAEIGKNATGDINVKAVKIEDIALSDEDKAVIGSRPVYDLKISSGDTTISSFGGGTAMVSIPYTPAKGEDTSKIVVYYISGNGELIMVPGCVYDAATGTVTFKTTHFSSYAVGYNDVSFADVSGWDTDHVSYLAARGIINGTGDGKFSPDANITRAQFVSILARMSGDDLSGYTASSFSDVATTDWYFASVQWAYKNGIVAGSDGKFAPGANITREQMAVMLYRYAKYAEADVSNVEGMSVREFSDYGSISSWALEPIQWAINNSIISGNSDGSFAPTANATRAQASKMIALLLQDMIRS